MKLEFDDNFVDNERVLLKKCGYFGIHDSRTGKNSYIKGLSNIQNYPRFHIYLTKRDQKLIFNLHLDQKKPSYKGYKAHMGENDSQVVVVEADRIKGILLNK